MTTRIYTSENSAVDTISICISKHFHTLLSKYAHAVPSELTVKQANDILDNIDEIITINNLSPHEVKALREQIEKVRNENVAK